MVSQLSARLLQGYSIGGGTNGRNSARPKPIEESQQAPAASVKPDTSTSSVGYAGDTERSASSVSVGGAAAAATTTTQNTSMQGSASSKRRMHSSSSGDRPSKRQMRDELNYTAATAQRVLESVGQTVSFVNPTISDVTILSSKDVEGSPFLAPYYLSSDLSTYAEQVSGLFEACQERYYVNKKPGLSDTDFSSTSSVTDSESDHPDEHQDLHEAEETGIQGQTVTSSAAERSSIPDGARIITEATYPFEVVHVNATFSEMTGTPSVKMVGRPVRELLIDDSLIDVLESVPTDFALNIQHIQNFKCKPVHNKSHIECGVSVSPIGPRSEGVSHLIIKVGDTADLTSGHMIGSPHISVVG